MESRIRSDFCKNVWLASLGAYALAASALSSADTPAQPASTIVLAQAASATASPASAAAKPASATASPTSTASGSTAAPASGANTNGALVGDATRGKTLYQNCTACHSIDDDDVGPRHRGVVGRTAGTVPGYPYSAALKASGIVWDKNTLDRWLTNPSAMVPGTKMFFLISDAQSRADIIAYLSQLH